MDGGGAGTGTVLLASVGALVGSPHLPDPPPFWAASTPQCEEVEATVQKPTQSLRHSKEELNRLNQAIQQLTAEVDSAKSQVRGGCVGGAPAREEWWEGVHYHVTTRLVSPPPLE